jgi:hypothetical protein
MRAHAGWQSAPRRPTKLSVAMAPSAVELT